MSSGFVSGGTNEEPNERDEAWLKAQQEIESKRQQKAEAAKQQEGKTLYDTLQANKAAKQEAFEESIRLKNQFRSLDDDEVEFLDSVLESTRAQEAEVKKQTREQLDAFKLAQQEAEKAATEQDNADAPEAIESWAAGPRKRKKGRDSTIGGVKLRRTSTSEKPLVEPSTKDRDDVEQTPGHPPSKSQGAPQTPQPAVETTKAEITAKAVDRNVTASISPPPPLGLGLAAYSSDEED